MKKVIENNEFSGKDGTRDVVFSSGQVPKYMMNMGLVQHNIRHVYQKLSSFLLYTQDLSTINIGLVLHKPRTCLP